MKQHIFKNKSILFNTELLKIQKIPKNILTSLQQTAKALRIKPTLQRSSDKV